MVVISLLVAVSYLLGSIPFGVIAGRMAGVDLRKQGSGNIGATNALRVLGKKYGLAVFAADTVKGLLAVKLTQVTLHSLHQPANHVEVVAVISAVACILGHAFPLWLGFRGGKGVATSAGAVLGLMPLASLAVALVWLGIFVLTRYVSIASVLAALSLPLIIYVLLPITHRQGGGAPLLIFSVTMMMVVVWRHRSNLRRWWNGTEPRFERR